MGVRTIATNGAMISIVGQFVRIATQAGSIVVLARILTPVDFGLLAMTYPIVLFATALQEAGLGMAVLQRKTIGDSELSTVFWISAAFGLGLAILLVLVSGPVAEFYGDPRIESLLMASSALVVLGSLSSVPFAVLNRELRFVRMSIIDIVSLLAGFAVSVTAAIVTQSYWALWLLSFTSALISFVMVWALCSWRPKKTLSFKGVKDLVAFGSNLTVFNLFNHVVRHIDNVLIGKVWGAEQLGFYDRAYKLMLLPVFLVNVPLKRVIVPLLVQARDEPDQYRKLYLGALQASLLLTVPPVVVVAAEPGKIIELLLGHGWAQSAPIFQWLSIVCILQLATTTLGWIFLTRNRARDMMIAGVISCILTCVFFVAGVKWGAQGVRIYGGRSPPNSVLCLVGPERISYFDAADCWMPRSVCRFHCHRLCCRALDFRSGRHCGRAFRSSGGSSLVSGHDRSSLADVDGPIASAEDPEVPFRYGRGADACWLERDRLEHR
jgi:O-antigen/teichoic acid export membrane protein